MKQLFCYITTFLLSILSYSQTGLNASSNPNQKFIPAETSITYKLGDKKILIKKYQFGDVKNIICINLHDNEGTSVEAVKSILELNGGTLLKIENNLQRIIRFKLAGTTYAFDPNRIFSRAGIQQTLKKNGKISKEAIIEIEKFGQKFLSIIPSKIDCVVALHNNTEDGFSIKNYQPGGDKQFDAKSVYTNTNQDIDDLVLTTDSLLYEKMADKGFNTVLQDNNNAFKDGSLSIYFGEINQRYINIETQHGKIDQYKKMFENLLEILVRLNKESPGKPEDSQ